MKTSPNDLFVNMPIDKIRYVFDLPTKIYTTLWEAERDCGEGEEAVTLQAAFDRIANDIHNDA